MKAYEDDDAIEDPTPEAITGGASSSDHEDTLSTMLLDALGTVTQMHVLLSELTADEFRTVAKRLAAFKAYVNQLPDEAQNPGKRIGFRPRGKRRG